VFVTVTTYRVRPGEEDAILALHEDWATQHRGQVRGFVGAELLRSIDDAASFTEITRFDVAENAFDHFRDPDQQIWTQRLRSLTACEPIQHSFTQDWSTQDAAGR
jgi:antibiotic biosynthesis monooxygenase (ABM) superfamily enzyme